MQKARDPGYVIVLQQLGSFFGQESGGHKDFELFVTVELEDVADAVEDLATHSAATRFEPAERAAVDFRLLSHLLLGQAALASEPDQHAS